MKKFLLTIAIAALPMVMFGQSIFDKYEDMSNVSTVVVSKNLFKLMSKIETSDPDHQEFNELARQLEDLKVFATEDKAIAAEMAATVKSYLRKSSLEELMRVKDEDTNVKFYVKYGQDEDHVNELLMFVSGIKDVEVDMNGKERKIETVLLTLTGNIDLNKINALTKKMNLPGELDKVKQ